MRNLVGTDDWTLIAVPDDGQYVTADSAAADEGPQNQGEQGTLNRITRLAYNFSRNPLLQRPWLRSEDGTVMTVGPMARPVFDDGVIYSAPERNVNVHSTPLTGWGYIYMRSDTGALEASEDPPDENLIFKLGAPGTRRYLGVYRNEAGVTVPASFDGRTYAFAGGLGPIPTLAPVAGWTPLNLTDFFPPHARMLRLIVRVSTDNTATTDVNVRPGGVDVSPAVMRTYSAPRAVGVTAGASFEITLPRGANGRVDYQISTGPGSVQFYAAGWDE